MKLKTQDGSVEHKFSIVNEKDKISKFDDTFLITIILY